jgi:hypothetical protein
MGLGFNCYFRPYTIFKQHMTFQKLNNLVGWGAFFIALVTYMMTIEPTASFWDCGEFIACSYKLEVPHPPGAPFFLLTGRMFSMLAMGDTSQVAYWVNMLSVLSSAFTILFLFWSITHLAGKLLGVKRGDETTNEQALMLSAGLVGALAFTFSDSFWFSAVEAEVYGMSSFFTAFVFWGILKWENKETEADRSRWLILIAYMMGLSIGVHLLNLVTIPALALIMYFKYREEVTAWGVIKTLLLSSIVLLVILEGIIPGLPSIAFAIEIWFVNGLGLPFRSGIIFFSLLFIGVLAYGIYYSIQRKKYVLNTALLCFTMIIIGYSSYAIVLIRSNYNPPIDENNPEDIISFVSYLKREQYGSRPLLLGQYYTAQVESQKRNGNVYLRGEDRYEVKDYKVKVTYDPAHMTLLPRMYSSDPNHVRMYQQVTGLRDGEKPKMSDNLNFMFSHQIGHMYMRYFLWNFSGRESDIQGASWVLVPNNKDLPASIAKNKARNIYFGLPLLLGLFGLIYQSVKNQRYFFATMLLFILTGVALVIYLNSPPVEPRERDYIYTGSYYVFAIWIGLGVIAMYDFLAGLIKKTMPALVLASVFGLGITALMANENWDDHDRSDRYFTLDAAKNYLDSCAPNAILFTGGDNDTFPLWYAQEVEGYRTDVRVIVLSYFNTDWYIDQMMRPAYESEPLPFGFDKKLYRQGGRNDYLPVIENPGLKGQAVDIRKFFDLIKQEHKAIRVPTAISEYNSVPTRSLYLTGIDTMKVKEILPEDLHDLIIPEMQFRIRRNGLEKKDLAILDLIVTANWERPIYFNNTSMSQFNVDVSRHVVQEGFAYRLLPIDNRGTDAVNRDIMGKNMMQQFGWTNLDREDVYYSEDYRNFVLNSRSAFNTLAVAYLESGEFEKAREVVLRCLEVMPHKAIPYDFFNVQQISILLEVGELDKATELADVMSQQASEELNYKITIGEMTGMEFQRNLLILNEIVRAFRDADERELAKKHEEIFRKYYRN